IKAKKLISCLALLLSGEGPAGLDDGFADLGEVLDDGDAGGTQGGDLGGVGAAASLAERAGGPHAAPLGGALARDEAEHGLRHVLLEEAGGLLLGRAADLADHDH